MLQSTISNQQSAINNQQLNRIEISYKTIIFTLGFIIFLWFLYYIRNIVLLLFVVFVLTAALGPIVNQLEKFKIPRIVSISLLYISIIGILVAIFYAFIPPVVEQSVAFFNALPEVLEDNQIINSLTPDLFIPELTSVPGDILKFLLSAFSNLLGIFTVLVLTFYFLIERKSLNKHMETLFKNKKREEKAISIVEKIERTIGNWVRGQLLLMLIIGITSYIGFSLLGLEYAAALAVLAGFLELVPNIGPTIAAIPAILVALSISPVLAIGTLIFAIALQQLENHILVPQVMKRAVGLNPIITIICLLIGFRLGGAGGAILAIPAFLTLRVLVAEIYSLRKNLTSRNNS